MKRRRVSGILCHPTCMPGPDGIGDLGSGIRAFLDFCAEAGQALWQVLPLSPTGYGDSPYQPFSAFAGNPLLISLDLLRADGLLTTADLADRPAFPGNRVDYGAAIAHKDRVLRRSHARFLEVGDLDTRARYLTFCDENAPWLDDFALFMALKLEHGWAPWVDWPEDIALHRPAAVSKWWQRLAGEIGFRRYAQFLFDAQWRQVRDYASAKGITIMGDMPIFVGHDSADVWAHRDLYYLDDRGRPTVVAGVPPDYFSATGQLWGNPLYRWDVMRERGYDWWLARLARTLKQVDVARIDHFRGFSGYWEVPAAETTAIRGHWVQGPGEDFFRAVRERFGDLPIVAEDLGLISEDVIALRERLGLPGMRVLQFGFEGDAANPHLPHNYVANTVAYTATHDNDTTRGWYSAADGAVQHRARVYAGSSADGIPSAFLRLACNSVADTAIYPLQDVLGLGTEGRLNRPGRPNDNWTWRYRPEALTHELAGSLREMAHLARRWTPPGQELTGDTPPALHYDAPGSPVPAGSPERQDGIIPRKQG